MLGNWIQSPLYFTALGLLCGVVGFRMGWRLRSVAMLPVVQGLLGFFAFASAWRVDGALDGSLAVVGWAVGGSAVSLYIFAREPGEIDTRVLRARPYRDEMFGWIRSGKGPESRPWSTAGRHTLELAAYGLAAVISANLLSLIMGAILLNYMNAYVSRLWGVAHRRRTVWLLGWNVWSIVRVLAYIALGSAAATPVARVAGYPPRDNEVTALLIGATAGVIVDLILKLILSRPCGRKLAAAVDFSSEFDVDSAVEQPSRMS